MMDISELLFDFWYVAAPSGQVKRGKTHAVTLLGQQVLLGRDNAGAVFALRDFCPHRGMPLRHGTFDGEQIECCYHGWCFDTQGKCTKIPSLAPEEKTDISRIKVHKFPVLCSKHTLSPLPNFKQRFMMGYDRNARNFRPRKTPR